MWVNQHLTLTGGPFGGFKQSGVGREHGTASLQPYTETQTVCVPSKARVDEVQADSTLSFFFQTL